MGTTRSLSQITLTRKRKCCKCGKAMQYGDSAIKYTYERVGEINMKTTKYWCIDCDMRPRKVLSQAGEGQDGNILD